EPLAVSRADAGRLVDGREQPLVLEADRRLARPRLQREPGLARAVQDDPLLGGQQLLEQRVEREAAVIGNRLGEAQERLVLLQVRPGRQRPIPKRARGVADEQGRAGALLDAEALARRAPAERAVGREVVRVQRLEAAAAAVAGEVQA